jgi:sarcosine oxidase gamma subunit
MERACVLELSEIDATVVTCVAERAAVDAVAAAPGGVVLRIAPDEAMIVREPGSADRSTAAAFASARRVDRDALVVDASDGWAIWGLTGDSLADAFARLSQLPLADGFAQGEVAHVPAKVLVDGDEVRLLVPAMCREAVRERILAECGDLGVRERTQPRAWEPL